MRGRQLAVSRPNTTLPLYLSLMAEPDTAVIPLKPFEESQCPTASPGTRAATIKGYHRHSSIPAHGEQATDTALVHFRALLLSYYFPRCIHAPSFLSICPSRSMLHHLTAVHHPIIPLTVFPCVPLLRRRRFLSSFIPPEVDTHLRLRGSYFFASCFMSPGRDYIGRPSCESSFSGSFHCCLFVCLFFLLQTCMTCLFQVGGRNQVAERGPVRINVLTFVERKRENPRSITVTVDQYCMETKCY